MKAKDFNELDFSPWETDFTEDAFDVGEDCLNLSSDSTDVTVTIRDEGDFLVVEWASDDDGDQILYVKSDYSQTVEEVYGIIKEQLDSF
ncbi:hypothetical protein V7S76_13015 [Aquirufa sp. ROCK2-A2]